MALCEQVAHLFPRGRRRCRACDLPKPAKPGPWQPRVSSRARAQRQAGFRVTPYGTWVEADHFENCGMKMRIDESRYVF